MKVVVALLLSLAALQSQAVPATPAWDENQEYHYEYKARVVTGIKEDINQFSGIGLKGVIVAQRKGDKVYFKFQDMTHGTFNQKFEQKFEGEEFVFPYQPIEQNEMSAHFDKPWRATYENGLIKDFETHSDDPINSVNVKRAILSMFQLNLDGVNKIRLGKDNYVRPEERSKVHKVLEDGIGGECETWYEMKSIPNSNNLEAQVLNVTKTKQYDHCKNRPSYFFSNRRGYKCPHCTEQTDDEEHHEPLRTISRTYYTIKGTKEDYTIERIYNSARYIFMPFTNYGRTIINGINQTVFLQEVVPAATVMAIENPKVYDSLTYSFLHEEADPEHKDLTHAHVYQRNYIHKHADFKTKFAELFTFLLKDLDYTEDVKQHDLPSKFVEVVHLLETLDYDQFIELFNVHVNIDPTTATKEQKYLKRVFYDIISNVGTGPSLLFIKYVIQNNKVDEKIAEHLLVSYPYYVKEPNEKLIEEFGAIVKDLPHKPYSSLSSGGIMAFGHLVNKGLTTKPYDHSNDKSYIRPEAAKKYFKKLYELFNTAKVSWERLVYLFAFQNIGLEESFPYMREIIEDKEHHYSNLERISAMYAMIKYVRKIPENVLPVLVPIYKNKKEDYHLRIAAFNLIIKSKPSFQLMHNIGYGLRFDNSKQLQSYVYSTFQSIANNSWPCAQSMKEDVKTVLELIPSYDFGLGYSKNLMFDVQNEKYNYGGFYQLSWIGSEHTPAPSTVRARFTSNVLGYNFDNIEIGYHSEGLSHMREKIFGPRGLYSFYDTKKSVLDVFKRHPRNVDTVEKELQEIESSIQWKEHEEPTKKNVFFFVKVLNQVVKMQYLDETVLNLLSGDGLLPMPADLPKKLEAGLPLNNRKIFNMADVTYELPTEVGLPISFNLDVPIMLSHKGSIKAAFKPGFFSDERANQKPTNLELTTDLEAIFDYQVIAKVAFTTPALKSYGFGFTHEGVVTLPIKGHLDYNFHEKKYELKVTPTQKPYDIVDVKTVPFTYVEGEEDLVPLMEEKNIVPISVMDKPIEKEQTFFKDYLGFGLKFWTKTEDPELLWRGFTKEAIRFISKYGRYFEQRYDNYSPSLIKRFLQAHLNRRLTMAYTPRMSLFNFKLSWEPNTAAPVTEIVETFNLDVSTPLLKPTPEQTHTDTDGPTVSYYVDYELLLKGPTERKFNSDLKLVVDPIRRTLKKIAYNWKRTPIPNWDTEPKMLCYNGVAKAPMDWFKKDPNEKFEVDATLNWGTDCSSGTKVTLHTVAERSDEQKELDKTPEKIPHYNVCKKYAEKGFKSHPECWKFYEDFHNLHKITTDIKYENLPATWISFYRKYEDFLKYIHFDNFYAKYDGVTNEPNHIQFITEYSVHWPLATVTINKPTETLWFKHVYLPKFMPKFQKFNPFFNIKDRYSMALFKDLAWPHCSIGGEYVYTYDNVLYKYPQTDCWQLAVKDAHKEDHFTVLYKTIKHTTYKKAVKAFFNHHKIEILPLDESSPLVLRVDGVKQTLTKEAPFILKDAEDKVLTIVGFHNEKYYIIYNPIDDIWIFYDGEELIVTANRYDRGHLAGLCGDFNAETYHEFEGPDHCIYKNPLNFAYSWSVKADSCTIPEHVHECA
jgi:hypothetical protein